MKPLTLYYLLSFPNFIKKLVTATKLKSSINKIGLRYSISDSGLKI